MNEKCESCKSIANLFSIRISDNDFGISSSKCIYLCHSCVNKTFINSYGYEFLKYNGDIYVRHPVNGCFDKVIHKFQIDDAFDPERVSFNKWRNE